MSSRGATLLPTGVWDLDTVHSRVAFAIDFVAGPFRAEFTDFDATLDTTDGFLRLTGSAAAESINIRLPPFRGQILGPEFFDVAHHPRLFFSGVTTLILGREIELNAELTVRGVMKCGTGHGVVHGPVQNQFGITAIGLSLESLVDRRLFGLDWNVSLASGRPALANIARLEADLQFVLADDQD